MSKSIAYKHYLRALSRWPKDPLRPETQFQDAIRNRVDRTFAVTPAAIDGAAVPKQGAEKAFNEKWELEQANALYSLLEGRYARKYPITGSLMRPASKPTHYTDLVQELEQAPTRTTWSRLANKWKGFLRFQ